MKPKKSCLIIVGLILMHCFVVNGPALGREALVLASIPWQRTQVLEEIYQPLIRLLEKHFEADIRFYVVRDYKELASRLNTGTADLGIFGGNSYVEAKDTFPGIRYLATCMQPTDHYNSLIIVRGDSGINEIIELKGKSFAFTDKGSTSGYVYPQLMLNRNGIKPETDCSIVYFLNKHDKVYDAVAKGVIDSGGVSSTALKSAIQRNGDIFKTIAVSDPIPRNAMVAGPHITDALFSRIRSILASASETALFKNTPSILKGFSIRSDDFYNIVREARKH